MTDCHYCSNPMVWPTLYHCKEHVSCFECAWKWISQSYQTYAPRVLDPSVKYELSDLEVEYELRKIKCPMCSRAVRLNDVTLDKLTILPDTIASLYPNADKWGCPFCKADRVHKGHLLTCDKRTFPCNRVGCGQQVPVGEKYIHALECLSYVCPHSSCQVHKEGVPMSAIDAVKHQKKHRYPKATVLEENGDPVEDDEEYEPEDDEESDDDCYYDEQQESDAASA